MNSTYLKIEWNHHLGGSLEAVTGFTEPKAFLTQSIEETFLRSLLNVFSFLAFVLDTSSFCVQTRNFSSGEPSTYGNQLELEYRTA